MTFEINSQIIYIIWHIIVLYINH